MIWSNHLKDMRIGKNVYQRLNIYDADSPRLAVQVDGLPNGVSLNMCQTKALKKSGSKTTCYLSGIPSTTGKHTVTISASDSQHTTTKQLPVTVRNKSK